MALTESHGSSENSFHIHFNTTISDQKYLLYYFRNSNQQLLKRFFQNPFLILHVKKKDFPPNPRNHKLLNNFTKIIKCMYYFV